MFDPERLVIKPRLVLPLFALSALVIGAVWAWLGAPVAMPERPIGAGEKLYCLSYSPFRHSQTPLDPATQISAAQIEDDLVRLAKLTDCVRTYSVDYGLDQIAGIAGRHGLKVLQGLWLSNSSVKNRYQIDTAVALANKFPDVIRAVVVGNEVLLRGEMSAEQLVDYIRAVKTRVSVPVTYADVWEFWLRFRVLADAADFVTIHILPYWEDIPIPAEIAASHVDSIRRRVAEAFAGKEIVIGEVGWPSHGRMREGALPSPVNQARVIQDVLASGKRNGFNVNVIEAFDQPWKRALEGTVGGHWGLLDDANREFKFSWGAPVSNHPYWPLQAAGGIVFAALVFAAAIRTRREATVSTWVEVAVISCVSAIAVGWTVENIPLQSLGVGGWLRSLCLGAVALTAPLVVARALVSTQAIPSFTQIIGPSHYRSYERATILLGAVLMALTVLSFMVALGLAFDPRYRDFPFAPMSAAIVPYVVLGLAQPRNGRRGTSELAAAFVMAACAAYIAFNETLGNWQSLWLCGLLVALAFTLTQMRDARG